MSSNFHLRIAYFCLKLLKRPLVIGENLKQGNVWQTHSHRTAPSNFGSAPFLPLMGQKRNWRSDASSLPWGRAGLLFVSGSPRLAGSQLCVPCPSPAHHAGDVSGEGLGRAVAGVHVSVSVMRVKSLLHRETWGAPSQSRLRGMLVPAETFLSATESQWLLSQAVGSDCSPVFWSPAQVGFIFLVLTLQGAFLGCVSVFWALWTTKHQLFFFSAKRYMRLSFTHPIPQLLIQHQFLVRIISSLCHKDKILSC